MEKKAVEVNFDGIVGPTHTYSGLSYGNVASQINKEKVSNPREAALQGLDKMKFLSDLNIPQGVLPPHERPHIPTLKTLGFSGTDKEIILKAVRQAPHIFTAVSSSASMWTANAATITPSIDCEDHRVHFTPANLSSKFHRSIEAGQTASVLKTIFSHPYHFVHHDPLPEGNYFSDEGAANHSRFCQSYEDKGVHLFVYGRHGFLTSSRKPKLYPARQTYEASWAISQRHALKHAKVVFAQQHPTAIDAGAFHNDVVSVGNEHCFFFHEKAFLNKTAVLKELKQKMAEISDTELLAIEVKNSEIDLIRTVSTYLFNSQLITMPKGCMLLLAPIECQEDILVKEYLENLVRSQNNPIKEVHFLDLRQSMQNGGGPACLRLRVVLTQQELSSVHPNVLMNQTLYEKLKHWIKKHYRDRLLPQDLSDINLWEESQTALDELTTLLQIGPIYSFQH